MVDFYTRSRLASGLGKIDPKAKPHPLLNEKSLLFDGVDESVTISGTFDPTAKGTVALWLKVRIAPDGISDRIFGFADAYELRVRGTGGGYRFDSDLFAASSINLSGTIVNAFDEWHFFVATYDSVTNRMENYVDAVIDAVSLDANDDPGTGSLSLGRRTGATPLYDGKMDEVSIWDKALSASEVLELYNSGVPTNLKGHSFSSNLLHWWRMGDGDTFPTIQDNQGSSDGTMINMEAGDIVSDAP